MLSVPTTGIRRYAPWKLPSNLKVSSSVARIEPSAWIRNVSFARSRR
jgi:hypothetical protein